MHSRRKSTGSDERLEMASQGVRRGSTGGTEISQKRRSHSWYEWSDVHEWMKTGGGKSKPFSAPSLRESKRSSTDLHMYFNAEALRTKLSQVGIPNRPAECTGINSIEQDKCIDDLDMQGQYSSLEKGINGLWTDSTNQANVRSWSDIPGPAKIEKLLTGAREAQRTNLVGHIRSRQQMGQSMHVCDLHNPKISELVEILQGNKQLTVSLIVLSKTESSRRKLIDTLLNGVLHPFSVPETLCLEFLAQVIHETSIGTIPHKVSWGVLLAFASRIDCRIGLQALKDETEPGALLSKLSVLIPHAIVRVCQLLHAAAPECSVSVERFLFDAWIIPYFLDLGRPAMALLLRTIGNTVRAHCASSDPVIESTRLWMHDVAHCPVPALGGKSSSIRHACQSVALTGPELRNLVNCASNLVSELSRRNSKNLRVVEQVTVSRFTRIVKSLGMQKWNDKKIYLIALCESDKVEEGVYSRIASLKNIFDRTQEVLAREALLKDQSVALPIRYNELNILRQELEAYRGEATLICGYENELREIQNEMARVKGKIDTTGMVSCENEWTQALDALHQPCSMIEMNPSPVPTTWTLNAKNSIILIQYDKYVRQVAVSDVYACEMRIGTCSKRPRGACFQESLGCCFHVALRNDKHIEVSTNSEVDALTWVFGLQNLSTNSESTMSLYEYLLKKQEAKSKIKQCCPIGHIEEPFYDACSPGNPETTEFFDF